nr:MAG TPA: hypothetical protein [Crassvirales sp.]
MWISILNYNIGQIEVVDITDFDTDVDKDSNVDTNQIAEMWLLSNGYNSDEVEYMLTDECPLCVVNNLETHLNL